MGHHDDDDDHDDHGDAPKNPPMQSGPSLPKTIFLQSSWNAGPKPLPSA